MRTDGAVGNKSARLSSQLFSDPALIRIVDSIPTPLLKIVLPLNFFLIARKT